MMRVAESAPAQDKYLFILQNECYEFLLPGI